MERGPCCLGVARSAAGLSGRELSVGGAPAYLSAAAKNASSNGATNGEAPVVGAIVIHDIWGFQIPNAKYIADHLAANGITALCPDLYAQNSSLRPKGWSGGEFDDGEPLEGAADWEAWWTEITSPGFWEKFHKQMQGCVDLLKGEGHGCEKLSVIGFCWGGLAMEQVSTLGMFAEAASVHGCHESADNFLAAKGSGCRVVYHTVPGDESFPKEAQDALTGAGASVSVYEGQEHGFAVRGDFANNEALRAAADKCLARVVEQFRGGEVKDLSKL